MKSSELNSIFDLVCIGRCHISDQFIFSYGCFFLKWLSNSQEDAVAIQINLLRKLGLYHVEQWIGCEWPRIMSQSHLYNCSRTVGHKSCSSCHKNTYVIILELLAKNHVLAMSQSHLCNCSRTVGYESWFRCHKVTWKCLHYSCLYIEQWTGSERPRIMLKLCHKVT